MRQGLGRQSLQTANLSRPPAQPGMGEATQERYGSLVSIKGSLEGPEWASAFLWDRHSKSVNILVNVRKLQSGLLTSSGYSEHKYFG